jgi:hypothetical protein
VKVVWNGVPRDVAPAKGELRLTDTGYKPAPLHKTASLPGGLNDFYVTPFAVVIGTTAKDPEMKELVRTRAQLFVDGWIGWQKFPPREFTDSEVSDADIARYSLLLYGGPGENAVTAKLAAKLPVRISANGIRIDGKEYKVKDAALQMLYPNPRNPERYVWLVAGTSIGGMVHANPTVSNVSDWDYFIQDGHIPARGITASEKQLAVVSGMFDYNWRHADALASPGASQVRAQGRQITRASKDFRIAPERLAACAGKFQIMGGPELEFRVDAGKLKVNVDGIDRELMPVTETLFYVQRDNVTVEFLPDASGQLNELWGFNGNEFTGKRVP